MADVSASPVSKKRNHDGELIDVRVTSNATAEADEVPVIIERAATPALSVSSSTLSDPPSFTQTPHPPSSVVSDSKKRKLTFAEKEVEKAVKQKEKEDRERQKAEGKQRRDEDRRKKNEEKEASKRQKEIEKAEKQKARDVVKQEKDTEKAKKDADKAQKEVDRLKREQAQLKIGSFFARPAPASTPPTTPDDVSVGPASRRSSIASIELSVVIPVTKSANSEFHNWIVPFFVHEHTELAPVNRFFSDLTNDLAGRLQSNSTVVFDQVKTAFPKARHRTRRVKPVRQLLQLSQGSSEAPIDLSQHDTMRELNRTSYKILSFREDVRPPYIGTFSRWVSPRRSRRLSRNPFCRGLPDINYDYDSEAEWQEPEEGDVDLEDEDEMSEEDEGEDEMDDFLDDEGDLMKRRNPTGEPEHFSSGMLWEGGMNGRLDDYECYRLESLHGSTSLPINPYSVKYWADQEKPAPVKTTPLMAAMLGTSFMQPPRLPLVSISAPNGQAIPKQKGRAPDPNKQLKIISGDLLPAFKQAVEGSDLTKAGLIEILKKKFPQCPKDAIKDTLTAVAIRQGSKEAEKKWVIVTNEP